MMLKGLAVLMVMFGAIGLLAAPTASAQLFDEVCDEPEASSSPACQDTSGDDPLTGEDGLIMRIINVAAVVGGLVAVFMIMWGGFKYITSAGDSGKTKTALDTITYAAIGLVVIVLAQTIVSFILTTVL